MSVVAEVIPFRGWPNALRLANGAVELVATLDVGPRILSYARTGGVNPFNIYEDQAGGTGEPQWRNRGGHRLWLAPEAPEFSYYPDNRPVAWERIGENGVRLTPPPETATGFQKQIDLVMAPDGAKVTVTHRITRTAATPCRAAPWALSVMAAGGCAILPQPPLGEHPRDLLPNRSLVIWPYTDLSDPRYRFGRRFITLRQDPAGRPTKIGLPSAVGWAAYLLGRTAFIKRIPWRRMPSTRTTGAISRSSPTAGCSSWKASGPCGGSPRANRRSSSKAGTCGTTCPSSIRATTPPWRRVFRLALSSFFVIVIIVRSQPPKTHDLIPHARKAGHRRRRRGGPQGRPDGAGALPAWQASRRRLKALSDIPLGHKIALATSSPATPSIKYGVDIGKIVAPIKKGEHVHVHNLKTKRW